MEPVLQERENVNGTKNNFKIQKIEFIVN